jgi:ketosteroid isomerase-like protein
MGKKNSVGVCTRICALLAVALVGSGFARADTPAQDKAKQEVDRYVHEIVAAYATTDMDKYFSYYADNMLICCSRGEPWSKQAYSDLWRPLVAKGGGVEKAEVTNLEIRVSPNADAAVAFYQMPCVRRNPAAGQDPNITYNMTEVWMKHAGKWQVASLTFSVAGPPKAP